MNDVTPTSGSSMPCYRRLWAKSDPYHPLWKHLLDASAVSLALPVPGSEFGWTAEQIAILVGLHDVGKADSCFQHQKWTDSAGNPRDFSDELRSAGYPETGDAKYRHERLSARFVEAQLLQEGADPRVADAVSRAVVAHHGFWGEDSRPVGRKYHEAQCELYRMLQHLLPTKGLRCTSPPDLSAFGMYLAGHVVLCDWIASNEEFFGDPRLQGIDDPQEYIGKTAEVARGWIADLGFERSMGGGEAARIVETPRPIQEALLASDIPPSLVIIEAPMGEGKTEAAWILAEKWRDKGYHGTYMALPTMATSDSLHARYRDAYLNKLGRGEDARLVHGMAWLRDDKEQEKAPEVGEPDDDPSLAAAWFRPTRRAILAAHGVGTVDQAMLAGMNVKFGFLRLYGLANRVLVIDEVHAYDAYMSAIIARLLTWCSCLRIPVVLLSATLSAEQRRAMITAYGADGGDPGPDAPYPLITVAEAERKAYTITRYAGDEGREQELRASSNRTLRIETHPGLLADSNATAAKATELVRNDGCCCVILNTVKQAQAVYEAVDLPEDEKLLFHARFTALDRQRVAEKVLDLFGKDTSNRPEKFVLVATQVVEQSLDVDFDYMISEIAPIDLLLQRSGRMHRHWKRDHSPTLHVLLPEEGSLAFGGTSYVYAYKPLLRTLAILASQPEASLPNDFRTLIERCYGSTEWEQSAVTWAAIRKADEDWGKEAQSFRAQGRQFALCVPSKRVFRPVNNDPTGDDNDDGNGWRAKTRLGANDRTAVLVEEVELHRLEEGELRMSEVRALYRRSVKLPRYLPVFNPADGHKPGIEAKGKLRGLLLLPLAGGESWQGINEKGDRYEVTYDRKLGLMARRLE